MAWHTGHVLMGMWNLPRLGIEPASLALAGGFLSTEPVGKSLGLLLLKCHDLDGKFGPLDLNRMEAGIRES